MATKVLPITPAVAPGFGMAELIQHLTAVVRSDQVNFNSATLVSIFELPGDILIQELQVNIVTAYDASGTSVAASATIEIPCDTGALVVWDAGNTRLQALTTSGMSPSTAAGWVHVPASGGTVDVKQEPGTTTAGALEVYLRYLPNVSKLQD